MIVTYHAGAEKDLRDAARFYEQHSSKLRDRFFTAYDNCVEKILTAPVSWMVVRDNIRRFPIPKFPYTIYFQFFPDELYVIAVKHNSRHSNYWLDRLPDSNG